MMKMSKESEENKDTMSRDFNTLMFVGKINSLFGWIMVAGCAVAIIVGFIVGSEEHHHHQLPFNYLISIIGVILIPVSLLVVASGQMISCFISTERNTKDIKDTNELLRQILNKMEDKPIQQEEDKEKQ